MSLFNRKIKFFDVINVVYLKLNKKSIPLETIVNSLKNDFKESAPPKFNVGDELFINSTNKKSQGIKALYLFKENCFPLIKIKSSIINDSLLRNKLETKLFDFKSTKKKEILKLLKEWSINNKKELIDCLYYEYKITLLEKNKNLPYYTVIAEDNLLVPTEALRNKKAAFWHNQTLLNNVNKNRLKSL